METTQMQEADTSSLLTLVDSASAEGLICLVAEEPITTKEQAREWLKTMLMDLSVVTLRLDTVKKAITEIDLQLHQTEYGSALVLNLAKLLRLPAVAPAAELAEFREMLLVMKAFFEAHPQQRCSVQFLNERDNHGRVYGSVCCRVPDVAQTATADEDATATLRARIENSSALTHWLRELALSLRKIGPWSWTVLREDALFGDLEGPYATWMSSQPRPSAKTTTETYRELKID